MTAEMLTNVMVPFHVTEHKNSRPHPLITRLLIGIELAVQLVRSSSKGLCFIEIQVMSLEVHLIM